MSEWFLHEHLVKKAALFPKRVIDLLVVFVCLFKFATFIYTYASIFYNVA